MQKGLAYNLTKYGTPKLTTLDDFQNVGNLSHEHLTVDIWHLRACFLKSIKIDTASIGKIAYEQIKNLTIKKANKLGLKGYELQAILWVTMQRIYTYQAVNQKPIKKPVKFV